MDFQPSARRRRNNYQVLTYFTNYTKQPTKLPNMPQGGRTRDGAMATSKTTALRIYDHLIFLKPEPRKKYKY